MLVPMEAEGLIGFKEQFPEKVSLLIITFSKFQEQLTRQYVKCILQFKAARQVMILLNKFSSEK